jgi:4-amino-4-deoxy-L-arabinose transferase-like glycosyltransferase
MKRLNKMRLDLPLTLIAVLSAFLNGYGIWTEKYANSYYTAAVASMLQSFHNLFYGSFDPGGFVTVDKPPVVFWIQTLSASIFGVHGWSVILPQALAGVGSVLLMYALVKPSFGRTAARLAALLMACTPIAAAVSRTNNIDSMLVFTLLAGAWLLLKGIRKNSLWMLMGAFAVVGAAFNMKMLQAYMVLPAFYLFYWVASNWGWKKRTGGLIAVTAALLITSLTWPVIVDSVPADERPYVGSSQTNSVLELAFGYNGISRLTGNRGQGGGDGGSAASGTGRGVDGGQADGGGQDAGAGGANNDGRVRSGQGQMPQDGQMQPGQAPGNSGQAPQNGGGQPPAMDGGQDGGRDGGGGPGGQGGGRDGGGGPGGQGGGMFGTGTKGPFRLFQSALSGQASWFIPFAFIGAFGIFASIRRRNFTMQHKEALFWLVWLLPAMAFFSVAGFFHHYYLIMLAPPLAALTAGGWSELWNRYKASVNWTAWLLPLAVAATAALQWYIVYPNNAEIGSGWSIAIAAAGGAAVLFLAFQKLRSRAVPALAGVTALLVLLIGPLYWAATPITYGQSTQLPQAGPDSTSFGGGGRGGQGGDSLNEGLYNYLTEHNNGEKFLFATTRYSTAVPYIIEKGAAVMAMGGYSGSDPILTADSLKALVESGQVKYFLLTSGGQGGGSSQLTQWIVSNGKVIPSSEYAGNGGSSAGTLYEVTVTP